MLHTYISYVPQLWFPKWWQEKNLHHIYYMSSCMTNRNRCMGGNDIEASRSPGSSETSPLCPSPYLVFPWCIPWYPSSGSLGLPWCLRDISPVLCPLPSATPLGGMPPRSWPECRMPKQLNGTLTMNSVVKTHICSKVLYPRWIHLAQTFSKSTNLHTCIRFKVNICTRQQGGFHCIMHHHHAPYFNSSWWRHVRLAILLVLRIRMLA